MYRLKLTMLLFAATLPLAAAPPQLTLVGTYNTGLGASGAEIVSVREKDNLGAITNIDGSVDLLDLSNPAAITLIKRVTVNATYGTPNSVAIHPSQDYMLVASGVASRDGVTKGRVTAYSIPDGAELTSAFVGVQPDSVAISHNGNYAVVANEAEGIDSPSPRNNGGEGSLSVIRLQDFNPKKPSALLVFQVPLPSAAGVAGFSTDRRDDLGRFPITNLPATLEPESVAFSQNSQFAYITLQENNGVAVLNLKTLEVTYIGVGQTTHDMDIVNNDGYHLTTNVTTFREPDGIALFIGKDGVEYFATADEGDTRNGAGVSGVRGGRTVSIFNAKTGAFVADTGNQLDQAAADAGVYPNDRSERGGSEPEVLDVTDFKGRILIAVGLERAASVALIDVTDATAPTVIDLAGVGNNPEGIKFYKANGKLYVLAANEASGTLSALLVE